MVGGGSEGEAAARGGVGRPSARLTKRKRDFIVTKNVNDGAEVSLREPTASSRKTIRDAKSAQERSGKKKSARSVRNDRWAWWRGGDAVAARLKSCPPEEEGRTNGRRRESGVDLPRSKRRMPA
jgi:hypothetical protein